MKWKREDIIFETIREAEVWAYLIANEMYGKVFDGYETTDYKIAYALCFSEHENQDFIVHTEESFKEDRVIYKVWIKS